MEQIQSTEDYGIFKKLTGNRPIIKAHLNKLITSIQKDNRLNLHPIIINENYEVIDGQHRLECAKNLQIPIYFIKSDSIGDEHFIDCNVNQRSFEVDNFIDFFAEKERNPEYRKLREMLKDTGLKPKSLLTLILGMMSKNLLLFLKTGRFKFPANDESSKILDVYLKFSKYAKDKRIKPFSMFSNQNFTRALRWICLTEGFEWFILEKKLDLRWFDLKPQRTSEDWYALLISIYNFKNHNKLNEKEFN